MGPAIALFVQTIIFWIRHRHLDDDVYMTYDTESDLEGETPVDNDTKVVETGTEKVDPLYEKN